MSQRFIVRGHRDRKKLTLSAAHSDNVTRSISLHLTGKRVIELSDKVCESYADALEMYVKSGALLPVPDSAE